MPPDYGFLTERLVLAPRMLPKRIPFATIAASPVVRRPVPAGTPLDDGEARIFAELAATYGDPLIGGTRG
jgi:hypothetical protein